MEKTLTKREVLNYLLETYEGDKIVTDFANHELELLNRKNSNRKDKTSDEDIKLTDMIINAISNMATDTKSQFTVTEILNHETLKDYVCESTQRVLSNSKVTALLRKELESANSRVVNIKDKKNSYYSLV